MCVQNSTRNTFKNTPAYGFGVPLREAGRKDSFHWAQLNDHETLGWLHGLRA